MRKQSASKKALMSATSSKNGASLDSHSSSSNSSCGGVATLSTSGSQLQPSSGGSHVKGPDLGSKRNRGGKRWNGPSMNFKQHMSRDGNYAVSRRANESEELLIDKETELSSDLEGLRITRKTNLSHLLNFRYNHNASSVYDGGSYAYQTNYSLVRPIYRKSYDKYQFIQANCKFLVDDSCEDFSAPDTFVDWEKVVEVQLFTPDVSCCPICLEIPTAPKITKCGHVYCFHCVLQLLSLSEKKWAKCPICFDAVSEKDLRCVRSLSKKLFRLGDSISLCLMSRLRNSVVVEPHAKPGVLSLGDEKVQLDAKSDLDKITKLSNEEQIEVVYLPLLNELQQRSRLETNEAEELKFIELGIEKTQKQIADITNTGKKMECGDACEEELLLNPLPQSRAAKWGEGSSASEKYLFYQSQDGQMIFANAFTVRCLLKEYGSLDNCPLTVSGQIVDLCEARVDDYFRSTHRFLAHLPLSTVVTFAELDLRPPVLSRQTLKSFAEEVRVRREEKDRKRKEERKRERKITRDMERRLYAGYGSVWNDQDDEDLELTQQLALGEDNFPTVHSSSSTSLADDQSGTPARPELEAQKTGKHVVPTSKSYPSLSEHWKIEEEGVTDDLLAGTAMGAQFTSFADVLMTTCASPPHQSAGTGVGGWPVARRENTWIGSTTSSPAQQLTYAQRMEAMEREAERESGMTHSSTLFPMEMEEVGVLGGVSSELLAPPSHNDAFNMAFQRALFKQAGGGGGKGKKKQRKATPLNLNTSNSVVNNKQ